MRTGQWSLDEQKIFLKCFYEFFRKNPVDQSLEDMTPNSLEIYKYVKRDDEQIRAHLQKFYLQGFIPTLGSGGERSLPKDEVMEYYIPILDCVDKRKDKRLLNEFSNYLSNRQSHWGAEDKNAIIAAIKKTANNVGLMSVPESPAKKRKLAHYSREDLNCADNLLLFAEALRCKAGTHLGVFCGSPHATPANKFSDHHGPTGRNFCI